MGFMDKAKKMAEQAQAKLDEVQKNVNSGQAGQQAGGGPAVEYDQHGRPITPAAPVPDAGAPAMDTPGVPPTAPPAAPVPPTSVAPPGPAPDPGAPAPAAPAAAGPASGPGAPEDRNRPSTEPPKMSSGDPLAG